MQLILIIIVLVPIVFAIPGWLIARKRDNSTPFTLSYATPALVLWVVLAQLGVGSQNTRNGMELLYLSFGSVPLFYLKVMFIDKVRTDTRKNTIILTVALCVVALLLRLLMPDLPDIAK